MTSFWEAGFRLGIIGQPLAEQVLQEAMKKACPWPIE
jgi:hypothetical protein